MIAQNVELKGEVSIMMILNKNWKRKKKIECTFVSHVFSPKSGTWLYNLNIKEVIFVGNCLS